MTVSLRRVRWRSVAHFSCRCEVSNLWRDFSDSTFRAAWLRRARYIFGSRDAVISEMSDSACGFSASTFWEMSPLTRRDRFSSTRAMALGGALLVPLRDVGLVVRLVCLHLSGAATSTCTLPFLREGRRDSEMSDSSCNFPAYAFSETSPMTRRGRFSSTRAMALGDALLVSLRDVGRIVRLFGRSGFGVHATFSVRGTQW